MKNMIVIFENLEEFHLHKDVGMIPMLLSKNRGYNVSFLSTFAHFKNVEFEKYITFKFFTSFTSRKLNKLFLFWDVIVNVKKTDVVMCFHGGKDKVLFFIFLKLLNPNIKTYIKLDMGELGAYEHLERDRRKSLLETLYRNLSNKVIDIYTIETKNVRRMIENLSAFKNKLHYIPNGFDATEPYDFSIPKEKIIISVGRIGTPQKNNELLLDAISKLKEFGEYTFYFIGPIEKSFKGKVKKLITDKPYLKDKVILTGNITDREELYTYYKKAEILCFTSLYEGFSLVMIEALYFGCYLISTDLSGAYDVTNNGKFGTIMKVNEEIITKLIAEYNRQENKCGMQSYMDYNFEKILDSEWFQNSSAKLVLELEKIINNKVDINQFTLQSAKNIYADFNWNSIVEKLDDLYEEQK